MFRAAPWRQHFSLIQRGAGGKQLGYTGNNGTLETDYLGSIDNRVRTPSTNPAAFMFGSSAATPYADFNQALTPVTSYAQR